MLLSASLNVSSALAMAPARLDAGRGPCATPRLQLRGRPFPGSKRVARRTQAPIRAVLSYPGSPALVREPESDPLALPASAERAPPPPPPPPPAAGWAMAAGPAAEAPWWQRTLSTAFKAGASLALALALALASPSMALAKGSGGRMGGSSFSSSAGRSSFSSSSGRSSSFSSGSRSSAGGSSFGGSSWGGGVARSGGGSGFSSSRSGGSSSRSSSRSSSGHTSSSSSSSSTTININTWHWPSYTPSYSYSAPWHSSSTYTSSGTTASSDAKDAAAKDAAKESESSSNLVGEVLVTLFLIYMLCLLVGSVTDSVAEAKAREVTVATVQVGLLGSAASLKRDLERICRSTDTGSPEGLHSILTETVLALKRNPDFCLYGFASRERQPGPEQAETAFNTLSLQERGKFTRETRTNVQGVTGRAKIDRVNKPSGPKELIMVTLLVAAQGRLDLPRKIDSREALNKALTSLAAIRVDDLMAVEVLWTPEEDDDFFTVEDLASDYPLLNTL